MAASSEEQWRRYRSSAVKNGHFGGFLLSFLLFLEHFWSDLYCYGSFAAAIPLAIYWSLVKRLQTTLLSSRLWPLKSGDPENVSSQKCPFWHSLGGYQTFQWMTSVFDKSVYILHWIRDADGRSSFSSLGVTFVLPVRHGFAATILEKAGKGWYGVFRIT